MLNGSAAKHGEKPAFLVKHKNSSQYIPVSYEKYKADVEAFGTALMGLELNGKKVAIIGENRYEWAVSYLAVVNGTGIVVPLDKELPQNEIEVLIKRSCVDAVIYSGALATQFSNSPSSFSNVKFYINMDLEKSYGNKLSYNELIMNGYDALKSGDRSFLDADIDTEVMSTLQPDFPINITT